MPLLDQYGNPIQSAKLLEETAGPSLIGARSVMTGYPTHNINPQRMAKLMLDADAGNAMAFLEMAEQIEEKDTHYQSILGTRKRKVMQMEITVDDAADDAVSKNISEFVRQWIKRGILRAAIFDMLDAVGKGYSVCENIWETTDSQWTIKGITWRDPRWFQLDRVDGTTPLLRDGPYLTPITEMPYKYVYHTHKAKSGIPIRGGAVRACAWMWLFKNFNIKDWVIFSEAYGQPIRIGKYAPGASANDREILRRAIANLGSDVGAVIPDSMMIEIVESAQKGGTTDMFERKGDWLDRQMSKCVLGQTGTTDAQPGGGIAGNQSHNDVRGDISRADADQLEATINAQVIIPLITTNFGPQKAYPTVCLGRTEKVDIVKVSQAANTIVRLGGKVSGKKLVQMTGLPVPDPNDPDDVLVPIAPPAAPDGGMEPGSQEVAAARTPAAPPPAGDPDAIGDYADDLAGDWQRVMNPLRDIVQEALNQAKDFDDFKVKLLALTETMDVKPMTDRLAQAMFQTRIAGNVGAKIKK